MGITNIYMMRGFRVDLGKWLGKMGFLVWDTWVFVFFGWNKKATGKIRVDLDS